MEHTLGGGSGKQDGIREYHRERKTVSLRGASCVKEGAAHLESHSRRQSCSRTKSYDGRANKDVCSHREASPRTGEWEWGENRLVSQAKQAGENIPDREEQYAAEAMS